MPDNIIRQRDRGQAEAKCLRPRPKLRGRGRNQIFEAEAKILASRPLWEETADGLEEREKAKEYGQVRLPTF